VLMLCKLSHFGVIGKRRALLATDYTDNTDQILICVIRVIRG